MAKLILFNKPFRVLSQFRDKDGKTTLAEFLSAHKNVYPAGRLDYDSEGLLLLTDNGALQHQISHPDKKMPKTYWVQVEGQATNEMLQPLRQGIHLNDGPCKPAQVEIITEPENLWPRTPPIRERANIPTSWLAITISEGRNRQVRRMTAAIKLPTLRLIRYRIGDWTIDNLPQGQYKCLEVHAPARPANKPKRGFKKPLRKNKAGQNKASKPKRNP